MWRFVAEPPHCASVGCTPALPILRPSWTQTSGPQHEGNAPFDFIAPTLGDKLRERWKHAVLIDKEADAGGMLGMTAVAKASPDGYTLGIGFNRPIAFGPQRTR